MAAPGAGRGDEIRVEGRDVVVVLGKNPASTSWNLARHQAATHLFLAADEIADGRDVSWFFDVTMTPVHHAFTAGPRARDMLVRLRYERQVETASAYAEAEDAFRAALAATPEGGRLALVATYTQLPAALALMRRPPRGKAGAPIASFGPRGRPPRAAEPVRIAPLACPTSSAPTAIWATGGCWWSGWPGAASRPSCAASDLRTRRP